MDEDLHSKTNENDKEIGKQFRLVIENCDGFVGGADGAEEVELTHGER